MTICCSIISFFISFYALSHFMILMCLHCSAVTLFAIYVLCFIVGFAFAVWVSTFATLSTSISEISFITPNLLFIIYFTIEYCYIFSIIICLRQWYSLSRYLNICLHLLLSLFLPAIHLYFYSIFYFPLFRLSIFYFFIPRS